ncbi:MAG: HTTM domain-containing protein [Nannocystis sp.]|nr:HTTM domain-containing protein [Nannocystis sp.]MBA3544898.1 HTTM domain-containing protein [Nannocystis sp.]
MRIRERWDRYWYGPVPAIRLATFRQAILFMLAIYMLARWMHAAEWLTTTGFHPTPAADRINAPQLPLLPPALLPAFGVGLFASIALAIFGWLRRPATLVALLLVIYVSLADPISAFTLNRLFILSLLVLVLAPTPDHDDAMPAWPVRVLQLTLLIHYATSGICKSLRGDWLTSNDVLWAQLQNIYMTDIAALFVRMTPMWAMTLLQHVALGFELLAPLLIGARRLRPFGLAIGVAMHIMIAATMYQLFYFSAQMLCFYLVFVDAETLQRWRARLGLGPTSPDPRGLAG